MTAARLKKPLEIEQGATWTLTVAAAGDDGEPVALSALRRADPPSSLRARMQFRADFDTPVVLDLSSEQGEIVLEDAAGRITLTASAGATRTITAEEGVFDLILTDDSAEVTRVIQGTWLLSKGVTK